MEVFWGRWGTQGTLKAPLEAVLERGADFRLFFGAFLGGIGGPFGILGAPGGPHSRHFSAPWAPLCSPGAAPRGKDLHFGRFEV